MDQSPTPNAEDLHLAHMLADEAAKEAMRWFKTPVERSTKADGTIVTSADLAVEDTLRSILATERPKDAVLGEERGLSGHSERLWLIDGIDGTARFAEGGPEWGVLIALRIGEETVIGILEQPPFARRYVAQLGGGAFRMLRKRGSIEPMRVSTIDDLARARAGHADPAWIRDDPSRRVARVLNELIPVVISDHPAIQVAYGEADATVLYQCGPWDLAAPALIVQEAGGRFSDLNGTPTIYSKTGVFSNGLIHEAFLHAIA
jgi:histidinol-phosphatase